MTNVLHEQVLKCWVFKCVMTVTKSYQ